MHMSRTSPFPLLPVLFLLGSFGRAQTSLPFTPPARDELTEVTPAMSVMYEAMINVQDKRLREAIPKLEWVLTEDPSLLGAWEALGWAYWLEDRHRDAENLWNRLLIIAPNEPLGYNLLAQIATRDGNLNRARELYETSLRLNPAQFETRISYARVLLWSGAYEDAVRELRGLSQEDPDRLDVRIDLAWARYANEEYEESLEIWNEVNEMIPGEPGFLMARANVLILIGALPEAEMDARDALAVDPANREAIELLADLAERSRLPGEAVAAMRRVLDLLETDRERARVVSRIAAYMFGVHQRTPQVFGLRECLDVAAEARDLYPEDVNANLFYGELLVANRQYAAAARVFQEVLDTMNPHNQRALNGLMETYFGRLMLDDAEKQLTHNLKNFNPGNPFRHMYWARLHFARGKYPDALLALEALEMEGARGAVFVLNYAGISPSEWSDVHSVRQLRDHLISLRRAGFRFLAPSEIPAYLESREEPALEDPRGLLFRVVNAVKESLSGQREVKPLLLAGHVPEKVVAVTFDGGLRNSFRYGTEVAEELMIPMGMFLSVGDVVDFNQNQYATFEEIREYMKSERWEIHSQLWNARRLGARDAEGFEVRQLPNRLWLENRERQETFREFHERLRREFRDSRRVIARELKLGEDEVRGVAYPLGELGQDTYSNIDLFKVSDVILNEAEITYRLGFLKANQGYAVRNDNPMLYKVWRPGRMADGNEVLRQAHLQHPVYIARRMRAEFAALKGELHTANAAVDQLRRDGYPEDDLSELRDYVSRHLARLMPLPEAVDAETAAGDVENPWVRIRSPYVGVQGNTTRANIQIEDWNLGIFAGANLNRKSVLNLRAGIGKIRQTETTNVLFRATREERSTSTSSIRIVEDGVVTNRQQTETSVQQITVLSNRTERTRYQADRFYLGASLNHVHDSGSVTIVDVGLLEMDGPEIGQESAITYGIEHMWRPRPAIDVAAAFEHGLVPSAREMVEYDGVVLTPLWRYKDHWHIRTQTRFQFYEDRNSLLHLELENYWRLSLEHDIWFGLHNSVTTMDRNSEIYWSPYWNERHYFLVRMRRSYPNYFAMLVGQIGIERERVRSKEREQYLTTAASGEAQGFFPGLNPERGWDRLVGASASVTRTWPSGWEFTGEFTVRAMREYIEHAVSGYFLYRF